MLCLLTVFVYCLFLWYLCYANLQVSIGFTEQRNRREMKTTDFPATKNCLLNNLLLTSLRYQFLAFLAEIFGKLAPLLCIHVVTCIHAITCIRVITCIHSTCVYTVHGTPDWFQIGKGVRQGCILSPCLFNLYAPSETLGWRKHQLESRLPGEVSITSDMQMTLPLWQKVKKN